MKHRASLVISYLCLLSLALLGLSQLLFADKQPRLSNSENRMLQGFPAFSLSALLDGSFAADFEAYLSDSFFARDAAASFSSGVMGLFDLDKDEVPGIDLENTALAEVDAEDAEDLRQALETASREPAGESPAVSAAPEAAASPSAQAESASIWLVDAAGEREIQQTYPAEDMANMARVLDLYRSALPEDGSVHFVCPPTSDYAFAITNGRFVDWGSDVDDVLQPLVGEGVHIYDATDILRPYLDQEILYPTNDWHWHPVSASLVAAEMLRQQGIPAAGYYDYRYSLASYGRTVDRAAMESMQLSQEEVPLMEPLTPVNSYVLTHLTERQNCVYMDKSMPGYRQYLGGTYRPWRLFETGFHTGRSALVIGDSFTNSFIPYLTPYYDQVISTDFRDGIYSIGQAGANVRSYIDTYGVDDVYVVFCTLTSISGAMPQQYMELFMDLDYAGGAADALS